MYQPRRAADVNDAIARPDSEGHPATFRSAPRRSVRTRSQVMRTRVAPAAVSVALLATSGAFALNLKASEQPTAAVPAPERDAAASRDASRLIETEVEAPATEAPADAPEAETQGAEAFVAGSWASSFGTAAGTKYAQQAITVRAQASDDAAELGSIKEGGKVSVTDKVVSGYRQIAFNGKVGYVADAQLGAKAPVKETPKPTATPTPSASEAKAPAKTAAKATTSKATTSKAPVADAPAGGSSDVYTGGGYSGPSVLGLKPRAMVVYNAVTAKWSFTSIGGYRASSRSNHQLGGAIDFMTFKDSAKGWEVAKYVTANAAAFNVDHVIFEQKIWTPYKPYWRPMADRGSITQNHYDHVHVSVKL